MSGASLSVLRSISHSPNFQRLRTMGASEGRGPEGSPQRPNRYRRKQGSRRAPACGAHGPCRPALDPESRAGPPRAGTAVPQGDGRVAAAAPSAGRGLHSPGFRRDRARGRPRALSPAPPGVRALTDWPRLGVPRESHQLGESGAAEKRAKGTGRTFLLRRAPALNPRD